MAFKWNYETQGYDPYELPEGASCFEADMHREVACAECGCPIEFGDCFTSLRIHTKGGFGYAVCPDCYGIEMNREMSERRK